MLPDLERLKVFYYIFHGGSIVSAAKELNITQSAVSQALQKLESELKTPLFTRLHKRLAPTPAAEKLFSIIKPFMEELEKELTDLNTAREKPFGELRIGTPGEFGKAYFPAILSSFRKQYPDVTFYLKLGDPATILPMISAGEIDFALLDVFLTHKHYFGDLGAYSITPIIEEEVIMACSKAYYDEAIKGDHSYENIRSAKFISYHPNALTLINWFKHHFNKTSQKLDIVLTVDNIQTVISAILNDMGMAVVASHLVYDAIQTGKIIPVTTEKCEIINPISLVELLDKIPSLTEKTFRSFLLDRIHRMGVKKNFFRI